KRPLEHGSEHCGRKNSGPTSGPCRVQRHAERAPHGGQICLPGGIPVQLNAVLPRRMGAGPWKHHSMIVYTSVGVGASSMTVRFNCRPEVTLHHLEPID